MVAAAMILFSCSSEMKEEEEEVENEVLVPVTVCVSGFTIEQHAATRATAIGDYANLKALTLAFYKADDGTEQYKSTQFKGSMGAGQTFGQFSTSLPMGSYKMVVLGSTATDAANHISITSVNSAGYSNTVRETFVATEDVTINTNSPLNLSATLSRVIAAVMLVSTDGRPADVKSIRMRFGAGGKTIDPTTGLATSNEGFSYTMVTNSAVGNASNITNALFLASDEQTMDITIETLDATDNVLFSKVVKNVPLKRNRKTTLTGAMYSASALASSFTLNTTWLDGNGVSF